MDYSQVEGIVTASLVIGGIIGFVIYLCVAYWWRRLALKVGVPASLAWLSFLPIGDSWVIGKVSGKRGAEFYYPLVSIIGYGIIVFLAVQLAPYFADLRSIDNLRGLLQELMVYLPWVAIWGVISLCVSSYLMYSVSKRFEYPQFFTAYIVVAVVIVLSLLTATVPGMSNLLSIATLVCQIWWLNGLYRMSFKDPVEI